MRSIACCGRLPPGFGALPDGQQPGETPIWIRLDGLDGVRAANLCAELRVLLLPSDGGNRRHRRRRAGSDVIVFIATPELRTT
jgi:hypothetical protein